MTAVHSISSVIADAGTYTDAGPVRSENQDRALALAPVFLIADGMGGHGAGRLAAEAALEPFAELAGGEAADSESVYRAVRRAVAGVDSLADLVQSRRSPGSTLTGVILVLGASSLAWLVVNLGDSRSYRWFEGRLTLVTQDHSEVAEAVRAGILTQAEAATHPRRNVVTRALGRGIPNLPDYELAPVTGGERWLMCSDGVSGALSEPQLAALLGAGMGAQATAEALVAEAIAAGSRDNATALVVDVARGIPHRPLADDTVRRAPRHRGGR